MPPPLFVLIPRIRSEDSNLPGPKPSWFLLELVLAETGGADVELVVRCGNGHDAVVKTHQVAPDGTVTPSLLCPVHGCGWDGQAKLDQWTAGTWQPRVA